jgi:hypothetical protein
MSRENRRRSRASRLSMVRTLSRAAWRRIRVSSRAALAARRDPSGSAGRDRARVLRASHPGLHFRGGLVGEGDGQDAGGVVPGRAVRDLGAAAGGGRGRGRGGQKQVHEAFGQPVGLAGAGRGLDPFDHAGPPWPSGWVRVFTGVFVWHHRPAGRAGQGASGPERTPRPPRRPMTTNIPIYPRPPSAPPASGTGRRRAASSFPGNWTGAAWTGSSAWPFRAWGRGGCAGCFWKTRCWWTAWPGSRPSRSGPGRWSSGAPWRGRLGLTRGFCRGFSSCPRGRITGPCSSPGGCPRRPSGRGAGLPGGPPAGAFSRGRRTILLGRLDRLTSGIVAVAFDEDAAERFREAEDRGLVEKTYLAVVRGLISWPLTVENALEHTARRKKTRVLDLSGGRRCGTARVAPLGLRCRDRGPDPGPGGHHEGGQAPDTGASGLPGAPHPGGHVVRRAQKEEGPLFLHHIRIMFRDVKRCRRRIGPRRVEKGSILGLGPGVEKALDDVVLANEVGP